MRWPFHREIPTRERIAKLNDLFRTTFIGGRVILTPGFSALPEPVREECITQIRTFNRFSRDNDPYGEHDFGGILHGAHEVFWKIDCYDLTETMHSPDPSHPKLTRRVLTIMLAEEY
jgi:hypothetical protein